MQERRRRITTSNRVAEERREPPQHALLALQRGAGNRATSRLVQRYVTDRRGKRMDPDEVRTALIKVQRAGDRPGVDGGDRGGGDKHLTLKLH